MHRTEPVLAHVRVTLGRREIGMAKQFLDHSEVRPSVEEVGGKRVSESVGMGRTGGPAVDDPPDIARSEGT